MRAVSARSDSRGLAVRAELFGNSEQFESTIEGPGDPLASAEEIAEIEAEIAGEVDAIAGDVDRMKIEAATAATAATGAELIDLRNQVKQARKDGAAIAVAVIKRRLGIF